mmetsp:Transcript_94242/g.266722  ORF Transcript_94242/g.266722 Transcript_94242/m.266722 type:complete len:266 (+) Transcript_94242:473-1270(+)
MKVMRRRAHQTCSGLRFAARSWTWMKAVARHRWQSLTGRAASTRVVRRPRRISALSRCAARRWPRTTTASRNLWVPRSLCVARPQVKAQPLCPNQSANGGAVSAMAMRNAATRRQRKTAIRVAAARMLAIRAAHRRGSPANGEAASTQARHGTATQKGSGSSGTGSSAPWAGSATGLRPQSARRWNAWSAWSGSSAGGRKKNPTRRRGSDELSSKPRRRVRRGGSRTRTGRRCCSSDSRTSTTTTKRCGRRTHVSSVPRMRRTRS